MHQLKYFIIKGSNGYPGQIHLAIFKDGSKQKGYHLIPDTLTEKTFCFDTLKEMEAYECPCNKQGCLYSAYLKQSVHNFRKQMGML